MLRFKPLGHAILSNGRKDSPNERVSLCPRFPVRSQHLSDGRRMRLGGGRKHSSNCTRYLGKWDSAPEEGLDRHLVSRVQGNAVRAALLCCLVSQSEAREPLQIRLLEVQMPKGSKIKSQVGNWPLRVRKSIKNGQPHVRNGDLRQDRTVHILHQ